MKPLGGKSYGSIGHLPNSRLGIGDHHVHQGQADICTVKTRDSHDVIYVEEKLDGSNVGVLKLGGQIMALTRAGYLANTSPYRQHHIFGTWVDKNVDRFQSLLREGERVCGEWLLMAHGTHYELEQEPFVPFDIFAADKKTRLPRMTRLYRTVELGFRSAPLIHMGGPISVEEAMEQMGENGRSGAIEPVEGVVYRVERKGEFDFMAKFVKHDKQDGKYLADKVGLREDKWNAILHAESMWLMDHIYQEVEV